jgi:hypothetical protein
VLPLDPVVSWEGHLSGAVSGIVAAYLFRTYDPYKKYDWEDESDDETENDFKDETETESGENID